MPDETITGDLTAEDALLAVQVFDAYLILAHAVASLPGAVTMTDETRANIKAVREKLRGLL